jgi:hypothetical protein
MDLNIGPNREVTANRVDATGVDQDVSDIVVNCGDNPAVFNEGRGHLMSCVRPGHAEPSIKASSVLRRRAGRCGRRLRSTDARLLPTSARAPHRRNSPDQRRTRYRAS